MTPSPDLPAMLRVAEAATPGPWERMKGRELVRALRGDFAVPLFEVRDPFDPELPAPTVRVGDEVVFRANSHGARESAATRQGARNAEYVATFDPPTVIELISLLLAQQAENAAKDARIAELERVGKGVATAIRASNPDAVLLYACTVMEDALLLPAEGRALLSSPPATGGLEDQAARIARGAGS